MTALNEVTFEVTLSGKESMLVQTMLRQVMKLEQQIADEPRMPAEERQGAAERRQVVEAVVVRIAKAHVKAMAS